MSDSTYDVIVVGAGPSGLATAVPLARAGVRVLLVEKHPGLANFPKATGLRPRTMEILRSWDLEDEVRTQSEPAQIAMSIRPVLAAPGQVVSLGLPTDDAELAGRQPVPAPPCSRRTSSRPCCWRTCEAHGAEVRFATELVDLQQTRPGCGPRSGSAAPTGSKRSSARYLVAADGARSTVRDRLGIGVRAAGGGGPPPQHAVPGRPVGGDAGRCRSS